MPKNSSLSSTLRDLRESTKALNSLTESATQTVRDVEIFLSDECQLGIEARILVGDRENAIVQMAYLKYGNHWRIALEFGTDDGEIHVAPWSDCSRDLKIWSIEHLPTLVMHLESLVAEKIAIAEETLSYLDNVPHDAGEA